jgi:hypothetical protein
MINNWNNSLLLFESIELFIHTNFFLITQKIIYVQKIWKTLPFSFNYIISGECVSICGNFQLLIYIQSLALILLIIKSF